jgi:serine/threonine-protein kinase
VSHALTRLAAALADRYRVERELGAGGMATVYLAHDLRHERQVAIKVLHPDLGAALGAERFLAEIKVTAKLQHPHILPLLDSGAADGLLFYVMPFVAGETLRARLQREQQLPVEDALQLAREVADALACAHAQGVIHRDIKPENILLPGGAGTQHALVADFGIALAVQSAGSARMTQTGLSLGTPQYMSPEQAMGERTIDARSDVYALGAVLYEMLTGEPPFSGATVQSIVAKVLTERPVAPRALRDTVPPAVDQAVLRALAKLPADRFPSAAALGEALRAAAGMPTGLAAGTSVTAWPPATLRKPSRWPVAAGLAVALAGVAGGAWLGRGSVAGGEAPGTPLLVELPAENPDVLRFAISADGEAFAFATDSGLVVRDPGARQYRRLAGTLRAVSPTFSPDGQWIGFTADGRLRKVSVRGGTPIAVLGADTLDASRVRFGPQGQLAFEARGALWVAPADGGVPRRLANTVGGIGPRFTPDGQGLLYADPSRGMRLMYCDLASGDTSTVLNDAGEGELTDDGVVLYGHPQGGLFAVPFDQRARQVTGSPVPLFPDMSVNGFASPFVITAQGLVAYRVGVEPVVRVVVLDPGGRADTLPIPSQPMSYLRFSPDGARLAVTTGFVRGIGRETGVFDFASRTFARVIARGGAHAPVFSPDGRWLAFTATDSSTDAEDLFVQPLDGAAPPRRIVRRRGDQHAQSWVEDTTLVFSDGSPAGVTRGQAGIRLVNPRVGEAPMAEDAVPTYAGIDPAVSPDGRWIVFVSDESGASEVYLRPFPSPRAGAQWRLSTAGGLRPRWSGDGRWVYFRGRERGALWRVALQLGPAVTVGAPQAVAVPERITNAWDLDGRTGRIAVTLLDGPEENQVVVVPNWRKALRAATSAGGVGR